MRSWNVIAASLVLPLAFSAAARATVIYSESVSGDLSNNQAAPTALTLGLGTNSVIGNVNGNVGDSQDWVALRVPAGLDLTGDVLAAYSSTDNQGFTGFQVGSSFVGNPLTATPYAGYSHFGTAVTNTGQTPGVSLVGVNLIPLMALNGAGQVAQGSSGFTQPLGPGTYTFLIQQLGASTNYQFDFDTTAVPEPGSIGLIGVGVFGLLRRRHRKIA